ncbi:MAG: hypothetical protein DIU62_006395 [Pseudomonadota bacterium]|jgi:hypothetical protein|nr:MAG: hypothetical protein DIU62_08375 [Pseudomonadota bacterium]
MKTARIACLLTILASPVLAPAAQNPPAQPGPCDRACLEGFVDRYLAAMRDNVVSDGLFAREVKFTENGIRLPLGGEGLWFDMNGIGKYRFYVPDVETQQVAYIGTVRYGGRTETDGTLAAIALRLKIRNNRITEVEQLAVRPDNTAQVTGGGQSAPSRFPPTGEAVEAMGQPHEIFRQVIPENKRATREELIKTANYYFTGLQRNDGKGYYPFTDDCVRYENGIDVLAGRPGPNGEPAKRTRCKEQFENGSLNGIVSRIRDRRFVAVDRERGIVFSFAFFDHDRINWTWQLAELFRIEDGLIRRIEAVFHRAPYGINSGWSTYEQGMSEELQDVR